MTISTNKHMMNNLQEMHISIKLPINQRKLQPLSFYLFNIFLINFLQLSFWETITRS